MLKRGVYEPETETPYLTWDVGVFLFYSEMFEVLSAEEEH